MEIGSLQSGGTRADARSDGQGFPVDVRQPSHRRFRGGASTSPGRFATEERGQTTAEP